MDSAAHGVRSNGDTASKPCHGAVRPLFSALFWPLLLPSANSRCTPPAPMALTCLGFTLRPRPWRLGSPSTPPGLLPAPPPLHLGCSLPPPHSGPSPTPPGLVLPSSPPRSQFNRCFPAEDIPTHQAEIRSLSPRSSRHASQRVGTWPAAPALAARDGARGRALPAPGQHSHAAGLCSRALGG